MHLGSRKDKQLIFRALWHASKPFCFLIFVSEEQASKNQKQNTVTLPARSGSELKLKTE
jgi:hypothetical protein